MHRFSAICVMLALPLAAADRAGFFELRMRPVLARRCLACHAQAKMGGLELTDAASRARVVVAGKPESSKPIAGEFGWHAVETPVHVHDLRATMLYQLGLDHTRLTYHYSGRDFRLTDVEGAVVRDLLA